VRCGGITRKLYC